jgi:hypothetical protein
MTAIRQAQMAQQNLRKLLPSLSIIHQQKAAATLKVKSAVFAADSCLHATHHLYKMLTCVSHR